MFLFVIAEFVEKEQQWNVMLDFILAAHEYDRLSAYSTRLS